MSNKNKSLPVSELAEKWSGFIQLMGGKIDSRGGDGFELPIDRIELFALGALHGYIFSHEESLTYQRPQLEEKLLYPVGCSSSGGVIFASKQRGHFFRSRWVATDYLYCGESLRDCLFSDWMGYVWDELLEMMYSDGYAGDVSMEVGQF